MSMLPVVYSGTFDPITAGHCDIILRAATIFPKIIVAVANSTSPSKSPLFSLDERLHIAKRTLENYHTGGNIIVMPFDGLLINFMAQVQARTIIRGIRNMTDFESELQMADINKLLTNNPLKETSPTSISKNKMDIETVFFASSHHLRFVSSSMVKELHRLGADIEQWVHPYVLDALNQKLATRL